MIPSQNRSASPRERSPAQLERDAALQRVSRTRRWAIAGATALSAGFAALVSAIAPGHSFGNARAATPSTAGPAVAGAVRSPARPSAGPTRMPRLASPSELGLAVPASAPQPSSAPQAASAPQPAAAPPTAAAPGSGSAAGSQSASAPAPPVTSGGS